MDIVTVPENLGLENIINWGHPKKKKVVPIISLALNSCRLISLFDGLGICLSLGVLAFLTLFFVCVLII